MYYVRVLKLKSGGGFIADLAAACATLYLFRSDPHELRNLAQAWATVARRDLEALTAQERNCGCVTHAAHKSLFSVESNMASPSPSNLQGPQCSGDDLGSTGGGLLPSMSMDNLYAKNDASMREVGRSNSAFMQVIATAATSADSPQVGASKRASMDDVRGGDASEAATTAAFVRDLQDDANEVSKEAAAKNTHHTNKHHHKHHHHHHHNNNDPSSVVLPLPPPEVIEEKLVGLFFSSLQACVETYFNYRWDVLESVTTSNKDYKAYVERELIPRCKRYMKEQGLVRANAPSGNSASPVVDCHSGLPQSSPTSKVERHTPTPPPSLPPPTTSSHHSLTSSNTHPVSESHGKLSSNSEELSRADTLVVTDDTGGDDDLHSTDFKVTVTPASPIASMNDASPVQQSNGSSPVSRFRRLDAKGSTPTGGNLDIPGSLTWVSRSSISQLYHQAAHSHPTPRGIVLIFHAGFSPHSCKAVKELHSLFKRWNERYDQSYLGEDADSEPLLLASSTDGHEGSVAASATPSAANSLPVTPSAATEPGFRSTPSDLLFTSPIGPTPPAAAAISSSEGHALSRPPLWGVVNAPLEVQLSFDFNVKWYPTIVLIPPSSLQVQGNSLPRKGSTNSVSTASESSASPMDESFVEEIETQIFGEPMSPSLINTVLPFSHPPRFMTYPEQGIRQDRYLYDWIASNGQHAAKQQKFVSSITRLVKLDRAKRFAKRREQVSAAIKLMQLQKCTIPKEEVLKTRTAEDPPVFVMMGGGMASGKTTAASALTQTDFWKRHGECAVVVDADQFKMADPLFSYQIPDLHKKSTYAAENLLLEAVNGLRDVVYDGTMSWLPYVVQTIEMVRSAHLYDYEQGPGWLPDENIERYWVRSKPKDVPGVPYVVRFMGITVDPRLAVQRGILRRISTNRAVPVSAQLRSFRLFAWAFPRYAELCDSIVLFNNNVRVDLEKGELPKRIAEKKLGATELHVIDREAFDDFLLQKRINDKASYAGDVFLEEASEPDWGVPSVRAGMKT